MGREVGIATSLLINIDKKVDRVDGREAVVKGDGERGKNGVK